LPMTILPFISKYPPSSTTALITSLFFMLDLFIRQILATPLLSNFPTFNFITCCLIPNFPPFVTL